MKINFHRSTALPAILDAGAFYFIENGDYAESYLTDDAGTPKAIGNTAMISNIVANALANWAGESSQITIVSDVAARDATIASAETNLMILVIDATGDPTVGVGSALYAYDLNSETIYKVAEYESMDVVLQWSSIVGGPTATPEQIDTAVSLSHTHANMSVLDRLGEDGEQNLTYRGEAIKTQWTTQDW